MERINFKSNVNTPLVSPLKRHVEDGDDFRKAKKSRLETDQETSLSNAYIVTTEIGQVALLNALAQIPIQKNGIYLGFSGEMNFNILANRQLKRAYICDIDEKMHQFYQFIETAVLKSTNNKEFMSYFKEAVQKGIPPFDPLLEDDIMKHYAEEYMWTADNKTFLKIKSLYENKCITHLNLNLFEDHNAFDRLKGEVERNKEAFDCIYVSNIPEWAERLSKVDSMKTNLLKLISSKTIFVDAKQKHYESGSPELRLKQGIKGAKAFPSFKPVQKKMVVERRGPVGGGRRLDFSRC